MSNYEIGDMVKDKLTGKVAKVIDVGSEGIWLDLDEFNGARYFYEIEEIEQ